MSNLKKKRSDRNSSGYRPLMIAALVASGILQPLLPVLAAGTAAATGISNTATATYKDDAGTDFNATSNTVDIKVAPIAGVTVKAGGITDVNGGALEVSDQAIYKFDVTNVGNTPEDIFIPGTPATTGIDTTTIVVTYQLVDPSTGALIGSPTTVPAGGATIPGVLADQVVKVTVTANVKATGVSVGDPVSVTLGNAGTNNNDPLTTQNIVETGTADADEVRTVTLTTPTYTINKEASAFQSLPFASKVTPQAFAVIKKTAASLPGATSAGNDDIINYNLNLSVLNSSPNGSYSAADLVGTDIKLGATAGAATTQSKILVSDAIPAGTVLNALPTAPSGWTTVYSVDSVDATIPIVSTELGALPAATWTTTAPALGTVKRVGFVLDSSSATAGIAAGSTAVNFPVSVVTSGLPNNGGKVYNIAQAFGQTKDDATKKVVVDESGDATPSNFNDDGSIGPVYDPKTDTGKADPTTQGVDGDPLNPNTGLGSKGEDTVSDITGTVAAAIDGLLNGPNGTPAAVGPTDANDDFTNASTQPPAGQSPILPIGAAQIASFKNTVKNPGLGTTPTAIADVTVQPIAPSKAEASDGITPTGQYGLDTDIPAGTTVIITELVNGVATLKTATYTYSLAAGVGSFALTSGTPVNLGTVAVNGVVNYKTVVNFPANTILPLKAVSIPVVAFADDNPSTAAGFNGESTNNITIDRVYTGFMKLVKEARVLDTDGTTVLQDWTDGTASGGTGGTLTVKPAPGQFIEYRIRYQNISSAANGSGNVILNAKQFTLTEDGVFVSGINPNTWASVTTHQQNTVASPGSTLTFINTAGSTVGTTDPANGTDVGKYQNTVTAPIAPASSGVFQFRRFVK
jgi:hypothetical protein